MPAHGRVARRGPAFAACSIVPGTGLSAVARHGGEAGPRWLIDIPRGVLGGENQVSQGRRERQYSNVLTRPRTQRDDVFAAAATRAVGDARLSAAARLAWDIDQPSSLRSMSVDVETVIEI